MAATNLRVSAWRVARVATPNLMARTAHLSRYGDVRASGGRPQLAAALLVGPLRYRVGQIARLFRRRTA